jgi:hypothetical protein
MVLSGEGAHPTLTLTLTSSQGNIYNSTYQVVMIHGLVRRQRQRVSEGGGGGCQAARFGQQQPQVVVHLMIVRRQLQCAVSMCPKTHNSLGDPSLPLRIAPWTLACS